MKTIHWLILITLLSLAPRVIRLASLPSILNRDEAALAYNALLITQTDLDEWGQRLPLAFKSFGDYKLAGYIYTLSVLFKFLPSNDWVVRLPSFMAGLSLIWLAYAFARALKLSKKWALIFSLLIATSPVFFFYSRVAFEANLALSFFVAGIAILIHELNDYKKNGHKLIKLCCGWLLLLLAIFTYNTPLLLLPFVLLFIILYAGIKNCKQWLLPVSGLLVIALLAIFNLVPLVNQKSGITIFQDELVWQNSVLYHEQFPPHFQPILGSKYIYYLKVISRYYLASFSPQFNVKALNGHPWHAVPGAGHILAAVYVFGLVGMGGIVVETIQALINKKLRWQWLKTELLIMMLLVTALLPAVITVDAPHATRSLFYFFLFHFLAVLGLKKIDSWVCNQKESLVVSLIIILISFGIYLQNYFFQYPQEQLTFKPGFDQAVMAAEQIYPQQKIVIVDEEGYQYILLAWYLKITPQNYFASNIRQLPDKIGFNYGEQVGRYHFVAKAEDRKADENVMIAWNGQTWILEKLEQL